MRELSLHILDLIENSLRAGASVISVTVEEDHIRDLVTITVEDDGPGLSVPQEVALHPFYTTKKGNPIGLGLSLFRAAAERAGGGLTLGKSNLGGLAVTVTMGLRHIDRTPLGNLAATLSSVAYANPQLDLRCRFRVDGHERTVSVLDIAQQLSGGEVRELAVAGRVSDEITDAMISLKVSA